MDHEWKVHINQLCGYGSDEKSKIWLVTNDRNSTSLYLPNPRFRNKRKGYIMKIDENLPFLRNLGLASEAHSEEDLDPLFELLDPSPDAREMGKKFNEVIGYNPITYYTESTARDVFAQVCTSLESYPKTVQALTESEDSIIEELLDHTETTRAQYAYFGIKGKIRKLISNVGEVPNTVLDGVMDSLERKYNLNYREPAKREEPQKINEMPRENREQPLSTATARVKNHPLPLRGLPTKSDEDDLEELEHDSFVPNIHNSRDIDDIHLVMDDVDDTDDDDDEDEYVYASIDRD